MSYMEISFINKINLLYNTKPLDINVKTKIRAHFLEGCTVLFKSHFD